MAVYAKLERHTSSIIRGTFRHFVFRLISLVRKTECLFISYFPFSIVRLIFDNFILCLLRFFIFPFSATVLSFLSFSLFTFLFSLYQYFVFLFSFFYSFFSFLILYSFFLFTFFLFSLFFIPFSISPFFVFLFTFFLFLSSIFFFSLRRIPSNLCWHISRHFSPFPCEFRLVPGRLQTLTWRTLCKSKAEKEFLK